MLGHAIDYAKRFTPTSVGTTLELGSHLLSQLGSPPRAWGQRMSPTVGGNNFWFTPTSVGTTQCWRREFFLSHGSPPRAWGQRTVTDFVHSNYSGSPPRAWGQPHAVLGDDGAMSVTPTSVGTTLESQVAVTLWRTVHPHERGDNYLFKANLLIFASVHPHERGDNVSLCGVNVERARFTPTSVGTTCRHLDSH